MIRIMEDVIFKKKNITDLFSENSSGDKIVLEP